MISTAPLRPVGLAVRTACAHAGTGASEGSGTRRVGVRTAWPGLGVQAAVRARPSVASTSSIGSVRPLLSDKAWGGGPGRSGGSAAAALAGLAAGLARRLADLDLGVLGARD